MPHCSALRKNGDYGALTYIRCEGFQIAHGEPLIARLEKDPRWHTERWDCGQSPQVTAPARVIAAVKNLQAWCRAS